MDDEDYLSVLRNDRVNHKTIFKCVLAGIIRQLHLQYK
jgi:hypothetical protein